MRYEKDGLEFPSVTEIISDCTDKSQGLLPWATGEVCEWIRENCGSIEKFDGKKSYYTSEEELDTARYAYKDVSQTALDVGKEVHGGIEKYLKRYTKEPAVSGKIRNRLSGQAANAFGAFLKWADEHDLKPIALEQKVYGNGWAGTLDFIGYFDDKLYVIDWKSSEPVNKKTGKGIRPEMRYQVAAYRSVVKPIDVVDDPDCYQYPQGCGVLRLDKTTGLPSWHDTSKTYEKDLAIFNAMVDLYFLRHPIIRKKAGR